MWKRIPLRRVVLTLTEIGLWITTAILVLLVAAFVALGQGWGSGAIRRVLALVNNGFLGRIEVDSARVFPDGTVIATNARILDPDGRVIIRVEHATAHARLWRLLHKQLELTYAEATGVTADFNVDQAGDLDIARAFQPRHPQPPSSPSPTTGGGFGVVIDQVSVDAQRVTLTVAPDLHPFAEVRGVRLQGRVELTPSGELMVQPDLSQANLRGPLSGPVTVQGRMTLAGPNLTAIARAVVGDSSLQATGEIDLQKLIGRVEVSSLVVGPDTLSAWLPGRRPRGARAALSASLRREELQLETFALRPLEGPGEIRATGALDLASGDGSLDLAGEHVDARALLASLPTSDVNFRLGGAFKSIFADSRSARAHLRMGAWRWDGQLVGPGQVDAAYAGDRFRFTNLDLAVPGARAIGAGEIAGRRVEGHVDLRADNLGLLRKAITTIADVKLPAFEGDAHVNATVAGTLDDLALKADLSSNHAALNGLRSHGLVAHLEAPRIGSQMDLHGRVQLGELQVADETFSRIDLTVGWKTPELSLLAQATNREQAVKLWTRLILPPAFERAELEELRLSLPGGEWVLQLPAHLDFKRGVAFKDFRLASGPQRLLLNLEVLPDSLQVAAEVENLDLTKIPFMVLRGQKAAGLVTATAQYQEGHRHRRAQVEAEIAGFALDRLKIPSARVSASLSDSQLSALADATIGSGKAHVKFDGPLPPERGTLAGEIRVTDLNASDFAILAPQLKPFTGRVTLNLALAGEWSLPQLEVTASAEQLKGPWTEKPSTGVGPLSIQLHLATGERSTKLDTVLIDELKPSTDLLDVQGSLAVGSRALGALVRKPAKLLTDLGDAPLEVTVKSSSLPLKAVGRVVPQLSTVRGTASIDAAVHGTARAPRGKLRLALRDFGFPQRHLGSIDLQAEAGDPGLTVTASMTPPPELGGHLELSGAWEVRPEALGNSGARRTAPLRASVHATQLPLALVVGRRSDLQGIADATAEIHGSLAAPVAKAQVALTSLKVVEKAAGELAASLDWNGQVALAKITGDQPAGGKIAGQAEVPLTTSGLGSGPLTARLEASAFNLSIFEPVLIQTKTVRALNGILDADLTIKGTRADLQPNGTFKLTQGELALAGLGELQHIQLSARIDPDSLTIDQLTASSGGGPLTANLTARRSDRTTFDLAGHIETKRFGVYVDDQLRAQLSSRSDIAGKMTFPGPGADVTISVRDAQVHIPTITSRDLAPTSLDPDIRILTWSSSAEPEANAEAPPSKPGPPIYLRVAAPGPIEVRGPDVRVDAKANLAVRIASDVDLTGLVTLDHGEINALGRAFKIYHANIRFGDAHGDFAPAGAGRLDIQAGQEVDGYRVSMVVLGRIDHPVPQLSSDPPLPRAQIAQLLATGSNDADAQGQFGGGSLVSNLFVEGLKDWLKIAPPLDVLTVDPKRLEAGKRITSQLYVGVTDNYAVTDPRVNGTEVHARYDLGHHFALDGRYGTSQAGSFDLQWRHNW